MCLFSRLNITLVNIYAPFSLCIHRYFCCFHLLLAFLNAAAGVNLRVQVSLADPTLNCFGYILSSGMADHTGN